MKKTLRILLLCTLLTGCDGSLSGTYAATDNNPLLNQKLVFTSGNKVDMTIMGSTTELSFVVEGNKVKVGNASAAIVWTIDDHGCVDAGAMGKFCKK